MKTILMLGTALAMLTSLRATDVSLSLDANATTLYADASLSTVLAEGSLVQFGYYDAATTGNLFAGNWVALTGAGSANPSIGTVINGATDFGAEYAGQFYYSGIAFTATIPSATIFAVRFYDAPSVETATHYGAVSYTGATLGVNDVVTFTIGEVGTTWLAGNVAFTGTSAAVPEPATGGLAILGAGFALWRVRRARA